MQCSGCGVCTAATLCICLVKAVHICAIHFCVCLSVCLLGTLTTGLVHQPEHGMVHQPEHGLVHQPEHFLVHQPEHGMVHQPEHGLVHQPEHVVHQPEHVLQCAARCWLPHTTWRGAGRGCGSPREHTPSSHLEPAPLMLNSPIMPLCLTPIPHLPHAHYAPLPHAHYAPLPHAHYAPLSHAPLHTQDEVKAAGRALQLLCTQLISVAQVPSYSPESPLRTVLVAQKQRPTPAKWVPGPGCEYALN